MIYKLSIKKKDLIGCYINLTNKYCLFPSGFGEKNEIIFKKIFSNQYKVITFTINGSSLLGCLSTCNSKGIIISKSIKQTELLFLKRIIGKNVNIIKLNKPYTNIGTFVNTNDKKTILSIEMGKKEKLKISGCLQTKLIVLNNIDYNLNKFNFAMNNRGILSSRSYVRDINHLESFLQIPIYLNVNSKNDTFDISLLLNDFIIILNQYNSKFTFLDKLIYNT